MIQPVSYLQTDQRWGSLDYSAPGEKTTIAASVCGPTAMAMVLATWAVYADQIRAIEAYPDIC